MLGPPVGGLAPREANGDIEDFRSVDIHTGLAVKAKEVVH